MWLVGNERIVVELNHFSKVGVERTLKAIGTGKHIGLQGGNAALGPWQEQKGVGNKIKACGARPHERIY